VIWLTKWRRQRNCMHHRLGVAGNLIGASLATSFVTGQLIDLGRRKMFTCRVCDQRWFT